MVQQDLTVLEACININRFYIKSYIPNREYLSKIYSKDECQNILPELIARYPNIKHIGIEESDEIYPEIFDKLADILLTSDKINSVIVSFGLIFDRFKCSENCKSPQFMSWRTRRDKLKLALKEALEYNIHIINGRIPEGADQYLEKILTRNRNLAKLKEKKPELYIGRLINIYNRMVDKKVSMILHDNKTPTAAEYHKALDEVKYAVKDYGISREIEKIKKSMSLRELAAIELAQLNPRHDDCAPIAKASNSYKQQILRFTPINSNMYKFLKPPVKRKRKRV